MNEHTQCCCEQCVQKRRAMVLRSHPLLSKKDEEVPPTLIPVEQALAMALEEKEALLRRLAIVDSDIKNLRDCV